MKINKKTENILRWIALPFSIFLGKPIAMLFLGFQSWFVSPDSFYYTNIIPIMIEGLGGLLMIIIVAYVAPSYKKTVANIIYGAFLMLMIMGIILVPEDWFVLIVTIAGMTLGLYYVHTEEIDFKIKN